MCFREEANAIMGPRSYSGFCDRGTRRGADMAEQADRKLSPFITCRSPSPPPLEAPSPSLSSSAVGLYPFKEIESKWSRYYAENAGDFSPPLPGQGDAEQSRRVSDARLPTLEARPFAGLPSPDEKGTQPSSTEAFPSFQERRKFYILSMIPYPSGEGLHVGHSLTYTIADVVARYQRLRLRGELVKSREKTDQSRCAAATRNNISVLPSAAARATNGVGSGHQPAESPLTELSGSLESTSHQETRSAHESRAQPFRPVRTSIRDALDQGVKQEAHVTCAAENAPGEEAPAAVPECASRARETPPHPDVLHVMGWDSFGLPAEQHAVASGISPCLSVRRNIDRFRQQLQRLGVCVDWRREVNTSSPEFYRWTQWIVVQMMKRGLVYEKLANVNWCEDLGTVLANEEVIDGFSERGGFPVTSRMLRQWHLRITAYADQLLAGLETLDWPADVKRMQRNWIGRRDVLLLDLAVSDCRDGVKARNETHRHGQERSGFKGNCVGSAVVPKRLRCVATSPELIFGVTFVVIHSSHPAASVLARTPSSRDCSTKKATGGKMVSGKEELSEGYFAGVEVDHPLIPAKKLPVWISDSLFTQLHGFGGLYNEMDALLVAPESEPRAREFAQQRGIDVAHILDVNGETKKSFQVDKPSEVKRFEVDQRTSKGGEPNENAGGDVSPNSGASGEQDTGYSGEGIESSRAAHIAEGYGRVEPPPSCSSNFLEAKLVNSSAEGILSLNGKNLGCARQEVIRFFTEKHKRGCREVRFWHKVLRDLGRVACDEPFQHLVTPGVILGSPKYFMFKRQDTGEIVSSETVELMDKANLTREQSESGALAAPGGSSTKSRKRFHLPSQAPGASQEMLIGVHTPSGQPVYGVEVPASAVDVSPKGVSVLKNNADVKLHRRHEKMSKSRGNVVSPDTVIDIYGADSLRLYLLFMGPLEARKNWNTSGVVGAFRFLNRVWNLLVSDEDSSLEKEGNCCSTGTATADNSMPSDSTGGTSKKLKLRNSPPSSFERELMKSLVGRVTADIERMSLNTAIAALMAHVRKLTAWAATGNQLSVGTAIGLVRLLHPFAPFVTEELWQMIHSSFQDASPYSSAPSLLASATWPTPAQETGQQRPRSGQVTASESAVESINFSIHVDGKLQGTVQVPRNSVHDEEKVSALAKRCPCLKKWEILQKSGERGFAKTVFIPARRIINFVT
ncbi:putative leucyl-tRNAsynthetase [Neospora caninum Liverpool]|uniref:leucine--tRNA ligase n=1 Tax=Neospora caninum (strain Liverpool) TaxID=572307 RepID=F0VB34_NEOCL|nr:putative leucyl-tRNAsynthetase [Neospora caninum Liverpool]CBZ50856.1 putative leucyl-tRNAsynthetase [Neospora caninum Liverpool]|eukprot:XP_003880889.1 putative leucyl-tRNAsynthetase [Neospora caninum Liverpool]